MVINCVVREKGLEPSRLAALAPKASVSTNSTTRAHRNVGVVTDDSLRHFAVKSQRCVAIFLAGQELKLLRGQTHIAGGW